MLSRRALVVGVTGSVGSAVRADLARNWQVEGWSHKPSTISSQDSSVVLVDATDPNQVSKRFANVESPFDAVIYCAGVPASGEVGSLPLTRWDDAFNVNVKGVFIVATEFRKRWERPPLDYVIIGSEAAEFDQAGRSAYHASKAAVASFAGSLRLEMNTEGGRLALLVPGRIAGSFTVRPEEVAALSPSDVARAVRFIIEQPPECQILRIEMGNPLGPFGRR